MKNIDIKKYFEYSVLTVKDWQPNNEFSVYFNDTLVFWFWIKPNGVITYRYTPRERIPAWGTQYFYSTFHSSDVLFTIQCILFEFNGKIDMIIKRYTDELAYTFLTNVQRDDLEIGLRELWCLKLGQPIPP